MYGGTEYGPPQGRSRDRQPARTGDLAGSGLDPDHGVSKCVYPAALQAQEDQRPTTGILVIPTYLVLAVCSTSVAQYSSRLQMASWPADLSRVFGVMGGLVVGL